MSARTKDANRPSSSSSRVSGLSYSRMLPRFMTITRSAVRMVWTRCCGTRVYTSPKGHRHTEKHRTPLGKSSTTVLALHQQANKPISWLKFLYTCCFYKLAKTEPTWVARKCTQCKIKHSPPPILQSLSKGAIHRHSSARKHSKVEEWQYESSIKM